VVVRLEENLGAAGRNLGVERLDTTFVAFADDDTWREPGSLRRAVELLESHPSLALLSARFLEGPDDRERPICRELARSPLPSSPGLPGHPLLGFLAGASVIRRAAFLSLGGFDRRLCIGVKEELVASDVACRGWCIRYVPELIVHHDASPWCDVHRRTWHIVRKALWFAWLRRPWPGALRRTLTIARPLLRDRATLRGIAAALAGLAWILRERRVMPRAGFELCLHLQCIMASWRRDRRYA
jgi:N-acetylglucosaminyl-diphospho-decaprenol L-rhamnosyltransferase